MFTIPGVPLPAGISNHMPGKVRDENTYPFSNFNGAAVEVWKWISNCIPHFIMDVINVIIHAGIKVKPCQQKEPQTSVWLVCIAGGGRQGFTEVMAWIGNYTHCLIWDAITRWCHASVTRPADILSNTVWLTDENNAKCASCKIRSWHPVVAIESVSWLLMAWRLFLSRTFAFEFECIMLTWAG